MNKGFSYSYSFLFLPPPHPPRHQACVSWAAFFFSWSCGSQLTQGWGQAESNPQVNAFNHDPSFLTPPPSFFLTFDPPPYLSHQVTLVSVWHWYPAAITGTLQTNKKVFRGAISPTPLLCPPPTRGRRVDFTVLRHQQKKNPVHCYWMQYTDNLVSCSNLACFLLRKLWRGVSSI